jgi:hypothetical protein
VRGTHPTRYLHKTTLIVKLIVKLISKLISNTHKHRGAAKQHGCSPMLTHKARVLQHCWAACVVEPDGGSPCPHSSPQSPWCPESSPRRAQSAPSRTATWLCRWRRGCPAIIQAKNRAPHAASHAAVWPGKMCQPSSCRGCSEAESVPSLNETENTHDILKPACQGAVTAMSTSPQVCCAPLLLDLRQASSRRAMLLEEFSSSPGSSPVLQRAATRHYLPRVPLARPVKMPECKYAHRPQNQCTNAESWVRAATCVPSSRPHHSTGSSRTSSSPPSVPQAQHKNERYGLG